MRWSLLIAVFGLSITDAASFAQGQPDGQRPMTTRSTPEDAGFFASTGVVRFQLVQGRLCLDAPRHRKGSQSRDENGVYESITVTAERGIPSMHYVYQTQRQHLTLSVQEADAMRLESWSPEVGERSVLDQPAVGHMTWTHRRGDVESIHHGSTLLHLRCCDPANFDQHFGIMFGRLLQGQTIADLSAQVQADLFRDPSLAQVPDIVGIEQCVRQLRSPKRAKRVMAEHQLLSWGTPIIPAIQNLPADDLDGEQRERLRSILARLRRLDNDTPATLAKLLVNDRRYWTLIAHQLSEQEVAIANSHLQRVGLQPIEQAALSTERIASTRE